MDAKTIVETIENILQEKGMKKAEFYQKSGVSSASFSQWRHNIGFPQRLALERINAVLGTSFAVSGPAEGKKPATDTGDGLADKIAILDPDFEKLFADFVELAAANPEAAKRFLSFAVQELQFSRPELQQ